VRRPAEHLLDVLGLENHHESRVKERAEGDDIAVTAPASIEEARRREDEPERLDEPRQRWSRRKPRDPGGGRGHGRILTDGPNAESPHRTLPLWARSGRGARASTHFRSARKQKRHLALPHPHAKERLRARLHAKQLGAPPL